MDSAKLISQKRQYMVINTDQAKKITTEYLRTTPLKNKDITYGLPEIHDRYNIWNIPILYNNKVIGEITIDAYTGSINKKLSTKFNIFLRRIDKVALNENIHKPKEKKKKFKYILSELQNTIALGASESVLRHLPEQSIDLIFTSPPYYNAKKEYSEYDTYEDYLDTMKDVIHQCNRVLIEGKFFVINSSHVLIPRPNRNASSSRIPVPFDLHQIIIDEGFEFIDDIIWQKPEGAGWASGRGRRFSADRNPMQYKAVPVTEYVMVYRKKPTHLIDNFIRKHPNQNIISESKIADGYEKTNVWYISPARDKRHPAIFPDELAEKVIQYYSFKNDIVLDPFGGLGTTAKAAAKLSRKFYSIELNPDYITATKKELSKKHNLLNSSYDFTFLDYSKEIRRTPPKSLRHIIKELLSLGISEKDIINKLEKLKKS